MTRVKIINKEWLVISKGIYKISEIEAIGPQHNSSELLIHSKNSEDPFIHDLGDNCYPTFEKVIEKLEGIKGS